MLAVFLILISVYFTYSQTLDEKNPENIIDDLIFFNSTFPRLEGTSGERQAVKFIEERLKRLGLDYSLLDYRDMEGGFTFSKSIRVTIPGKINDTLLVVIPVNSPEHALQGRDGSINLALGLGMLKELVHSPPNIKVEFLFLGGEYGEGNFYPIGSKQFLNDYFTPDPTTVLYLAFKAIPRRILLRYGGYKVVSPYWLINRLSKAMGNANLFNLTLGNENQFFRLGLEDNSSPVESYLRDGYPAVSIEGSATPLDPKKQKNWIRDFLIFFNQFLQLNAQGFPEQWDRHYLFFQVKDAYVIINEQSYLLFLMFCLLGSLAYSLIYTRQISRYLSLVLKKIWTIPLLLGLVFLFLFLSTLAIQGVLNLRKFLSLWEYIPPLFILLKLLLSLFLFFLFFRFLKILPIPHRGSYYTGAALFFNLINIILFSFINISLSYYPLWTFIWTFFFSITSNRFLKLLFFLITPLMTLKVLLDVLTLPVLGISKILILSPLKGNLIIALALLPHIFLVIRLFFLFRHPNKKIQKRLTLASDIFLGAVIISMVTVIFLYSPYNQSNPQPITIQDSIDYTADKRTLAITSPTSLGQLSLTAEKFTLNVNSSQTSYVQPLSYLPVYLQTVLSTSTFLDRKHYKLKLILPGQPFQIRLKLISHDNIIVYDSNFPITLSPGDNKATIYTGTNPPLPLEVEFTLPEELTVSADLEVIYTHPPYSLLTTGHDIQVSRKMIIKKEISL